MREKPRYARALALAGIAGREAAALARQAWFLRHDTLDPVLPEAVRDGDDVVVFLHGLFATAGVLRPLRVAIERERGLRSAAVSYPAGPGVAAIATRLEAALSALPERVWIHLVGHSLGGVVARYVALEAGDPRIVQTISLASPFAGLPRAKLIGLECTRDLDPNSPLLRKVALGLGARASIPHLSIVAENDAFMRSPIAHALPGGDVVVRSGCGHNTLLYDPEVARIVARRVLDVRARRETGRVSEGPESALPSGPGSTIRDRREPGDPSSGRGEAA